MCCNDTKNSLEVTEIARGQVNELVVGGLILCYYCFAGFKPFAFGDNTSPKQVKDAYSKRECFKERGRF